MSRLEEANLSYQVAQDRMALLPNYYKWTRMEFGERIAGAVAEVGAGSGHFIHHYIDDADSVIATDYNSELVARLKQKFPTSKVCGVVTDLREKNFPESVGHVDTIIALDVLEHFEDDRAIVLNIAGALKSGGVFLVKVPAQSQLFGNADIASGHYRRYDPDDLIKLIESCGFSVEFVKYTNKIGALAYRFKNNKTSNFSRTFNIKTLKIINYFVPFLFLIDKLIPTRGLSLIAAFKKN